VGHGTCYINTCRSIDQVYNFVVAVSEFIHVTPTVCSFVGAAALHFFETFGVKISPGTLAAMLMHDSVPMPLPLFGLQLHEDYLVMSIS